MNKPTLYGAVEAGGTKFNCLIANERGEVLCEARFPTGGSNETLKQVLAFFTDSGARIAALGISSFGPIDLDLESPTYGFITSTPKLAWQNTDLCGAFEELQVPVALDTDVNGAALGEHVWGAARDLKTFVYYTIGTGIGGGGLVEGRLMHGLLHPEMGHIRMPQDYERDPFAGSCPFHGNCFEGLASGPAIAARWKGDPTTFAPDHPAWELEAHYIALALANTICTLSPQRIILGGGVMEQASLFPMIRKEVQRLLAGYIVCDAILNRIDEFIVPPGLGSRSGALGAVALAMRARTGEH